MSNSPVDTVAPFRNKAKLIASAVMALLGVAGFYYFSGKAELIRLAVLLVGMALGCVIFFLSSTGGRFFTFVKESTREAKKVVWPSRKETMQVTAVVFGFVLIMAMFLWGADKLLELVLYDLILGWKK